MTDKAIHEGRNVKRLREMLGIKQDVLAIELGLSQQSVSALEQKEALDKDMLEKIAQVLKVPAEAIKNFSDDNAINFISNTFNDHAVASGTYCNFNPLDKYVEQVEKYAAQVEKNEQLYTALLKEKDDKIALLEKFADKK
jgi:transcriptional regulator with XRE-family HTH domain